MGVAEWTRLTLDRIGTNMKLRLERDEDDLLLDEDPIGEFLSRKERMTDLPEDEEGVVREEAVVEQAQGPVEGQEAEAAVPVVVNLLEDSEEQEEVMSEPTLAKVEVIEADAEVAKETVTEADIDTSTEDGDADAESAAATAADEPPLVSEAELSEDDPTAEENIAEKLDGLETVGGEESQQEDDVDSLLDVFKEEESSGSPISALARDLDDTDINSLLEETKWIASRVRGTSTEGNQAP